MVDSASLMVSLAGQMIGEATKSWLKSDSSSTLKEILAASVRSDDSDSFEEILKWLSAKLEPELQSGVRDRDRLSIPSWNDTLELDQAEAVAAAFTFSEKVTGSPLASNTRDKPSGDTGFDLVEPEKRLGVGLGYDEINKRFIPVYLTESDALRDKALRYFNEVGVKATVHNVGAAQSARPTDVVQRSRAVDCSRHRPGRPLGYRPGEYGSLGIYVAYKAPRIGRIAGMVSARHVMKPVNNQGDFDLYSPIPPFVPAAMSSHSIFRYVDGPALFHYLHADDPNKIINKVDIGLASIPERPDDMVNMVPNPQNPKIAEMADDDYGALDSTWTEARFEPLELTRPLDMGDKSRLTSLFLNNKVYKFGATSGLTRGKVISFKIKSFRIKMPNNWNYLFGNIVAVQSTLPGVPFSEAGDSGACVYTEDGEVLGTIIGAGRDFSYVSPLADGFKALEDYDCEILTRDMLTSLP